MLRTLRDDIETASVRWWWQWVACPGVLHRPRHLNPMFVSMRWMEGLDFCEIFADLPELHFSVKEIAVIILK